MSRKGGKRQLQRIADRQQETAKPQLTKTERVKDQRPKSNRSSQGPAQKNERVKEQRPKPTRRTEEPAQKPEHKMERVKEQRPKPNRSTHVGTKSERGMGQRKQVAVTFGAATVWRLELPAELFSEVLGFAALPTLGALCATSRAGWQLWAEPRLWAAFGAGGAEQFRKQRFALQAGWASELLALCGQDAPRALARACDLAGGLAWTERADAGAVLAALTTTAGKCAPGLAVELLEAAVPKVAKRAEIFGSCAGLRGLRDEQLERKILQDIDDQQAEEDAAVHFDYFEEPGLPEPPAFWDELEQLAPAKEECYFEVLEDAVSAPCIPEEESRLLAVDFLEALSLHHGHDWAATTAAMEAMEAH